MKKRRDTEIFSLSFLDIITCGFGAIILLLVITKPGLPPPVLEPSPEPIPEEDDGLIRDLQKKLFEIRGETSVFNRELNAKKEQIDIWNERIAILRGQKEKNETELNSVQDESSIQDSITGQFQLAKQTLTQEMRRLLAQLRNSDKNLVGGIPVDSEYIIFVVDTSGSMKNANWEKMINQLTTTLDVYPNVQGLQIMSDMGRYLFSQFRGRWIPDTPGRRRAMISNLRRWNTFSNSSPVEGVTAAIRTFHATDKRISIYVFGDEFTGPSIRRVVETIDRINPKDAQGNPRIRIHGVGFPIPHSAPEHFQLTSSRFATLMREVSHRNAGTFIGLN